MNEETYLIAQIQIIENEYLKVLQPLLDRLTEIRIVQPPPPSLVRAAMYEESLAREIGQPVALEALNRTMVVCPICGNKRCPHATDPALPCTGSNEPGQPGSIYTAQPTETP
jgi:hypothetical protein